MGVKGALIRSRLGAGRRELTERRLLTTQQSLECLGTAESLGILGHSQLVAIDNPLERPASVYFVPDILGVRQEMTCQM